MLKGKDQQQLDLKYIKQNGKPHNISLLESASHSGLNLRESSQSRLEDKPKPQARPHSVYWKDMVDSGYVKEKVIKVYHYTCYTYMF